MGVGGQRHAPASLPTGKTRYPLYRRLGGPQGRSGLMRNISPPPGFDPRTVQPVASRYTDCFDVDNEKVFISRCTNSKKEKIYQTHFLLLTLERLSHWPRGLRRVSAAARLLESCVRIPPEAWMSVVSVVC
jgi:hypothetical protein